MVTDISRRAILAISAIAVSVIGGIAMFRRSDSGGNGTDAEDDDPEENDMDDDDSDDPGSEEDTDDTGDDDGGDDTDDGIIRIDYDDHDDPSEIYNVNDNRSGIPPEFVSEPTYSGSSALRMEFSQDQKTANVEYRFPENDHHDGLAEYDMAEELFVRFKLYPDGFELGENDTMRIFWLPLTNGDGSSGGGTPDGTNGWSNAIGFSHRNDSPAPEGYHFFSYSYHIGASGDFEMTDAPIWMDEWNDIAGYVRCNTIENGVARPDGVMRYWVNGELAYERTDFRMTTTESNRIEGNGPLGYRVGDQQFSNALIYDDHEMRIGYNPGTSLP